MKTVLFLCTGNYYRSRYAEILFNSKAEKMGLQWNAVSRGLAPDPRNPGPMFRDTMEALQQQGIFFENHLRLPIKVTEADFESNDHVVAVKEAEHRPIIQRNFPQWLNQVGNSTFVARVFSRLDARSGPERLSPSCDCFL